MDYISACRKDLNIDQVKSIIDLALELGIRDFGFSGGEPFMRKDFIEILRYVPDYPIHILSNGLLITERHLQEINEAKSLVEFRVSLDGLESHKQIRSVGWKEVTDKIRMIKGFDFVTSVNTMITPFNYDELPSMFDLMIELKVDRWRLDFVYDAGNARKNDFEVDETRTFQTLKYIIERYIKERPSFELDVNKYFRSLFLDGSEPMKYDLNSEPCEYQAALTVRPNGDISFCPSLDMTFGNILNDSLKDIVGSSEWQRIAGVRVRDLDDKCHSCDLLSLCGGGCRADALYSTGSFYKPCEFNCRAMKFYRDEIEPVIISSH